MMLPSGLLQVFFSNRYTYASVVNKANPADRGQCIASASSLQEHVRSLLKESGAANNDVQASKLVGRLLAEKAKEAQITEVHFDNHKGLPYAGKLKALIDSIRSNGVTVK
jgi:large subunit ribosomal protein L18